MNLKVGKILPVTEVAGPGRRFAIWVQGCSKRCTDCYNQELWDHSGGYLKSVNDIINEIAMSKNIEGVTLLGGEPFEQAKALSLIASCAKKLNLSVISYSGLSRSELECSRYTFHRELLAYTDVLIDGKFNKDLTMNCHPLTGSSNQEFHFLTDRYSPNDFKFIQNAVELHINQDGTITLNGQTNNSINLNSIMVSKG